MKNLTHERAAFLNDRALEMVQRQGSSVQFPDYGIALQCARPSFLILYFDPENRQSDYDRFHHLEIYAEYTDGDGEQEDGIVKQVHVFSVRWITDAELEVIIFERGDWEQMFLS